VTYTVEIPGAPMLTSDPLTVQVMLDELPPPLAPLADGGKLDVGKAPLLVPFTVAFPSLAAGEKVTLNWQGSTVYKTAAQTTTSTAPLIFNVPREIVAKDLGEYGDSHIHRRNRRRSRANLNAIDGDDSIQPVPTFPLPAVYGPAL